MELADMSPSDWAQAPFFPGANLDAVAGCLYTVARWGRNAVRAEAAELRAGGWDEEQEAAFTQSFWDLADAWGTYKAVLGFLPRADGDSRQPTREQVMADLERPRRAFGSALSAYRGRLLEAAGHANGSQLPDAFARESKGHAQVRPHAPGTPLPGPAEHVNAAPDGQEGGPCQG
jgi:hypothetical protein